MKIIYRPFRGLLRSPPLLGRELLFFVGGARFADLNEDWQRKLFRSKRRTEIVQKLFLKRSFAIQQSVARYSAGTIQPTIHVNHTDTIAWPQMVTSKFRGFRRLACCYRAHQIATDMRSAQAEQRTRNVGSQNQPSWHHNAIYLCYGHDH